MGDVTPEVWGKVISSAVVPVVMISACGLLCLAFYNRLTAVLARIRAFQSEALREQEELLHRPGAGDTDRLSRRMTRETVDELERQMDRLIARSRLIRGTIAALLCAIGCLVLCSFGAGASVLWPGFLYAAGPLFLAGLGCMLAGVVLALRELAVSLEPVEQARAFVERLGRMVPDAEGDASESGGGL